MRWRVKFGFVGRVRCWICLSSRKIYFCLKIVVNCIRSKFCEVVNKFCNWLYKYIGFVSGHDIYCCFDENGGRFFFSNRFHQRTRGAGKQYFRTISHCHRYFSPCGQVFPFLSTRNKELWNQHLPRGHPFRNFST